MRKKDGATAGLRRVSGDREPTAGSAAPVGAEASSGFARWWSLQGSIGRRVSEYAARVMTRLDDRAVLEPQGWIEDYAKLWWGVIDDLSHLVSGRSSTEAHPPEMWVPRYRNSISQGTRHAVVAIEVRRDAFQLDPEGGSRTELGEITLAAHGFSREGQPVSLRYGKHFDFMPPKVQPSARGTQLRLFKLPTDRDHSLQVGRYAALVWAEETRHLVAVVQLDVLSR